MDEILNAKVVFGLESQGHIEKIDLMLADGCDWKVISDVIGWEEVTARKYYERFAQRRKGVEGDEAEVRVLLAEAVGFLKKYVNLNSTFGFNSNDIRSLIFRAEDHLLSTPCLHGCYSGESNERN